MEEKDIIGKVNAIFDKIDDVDYTATVILTREKVIQVLEDSIKSQEEYGDD